MYSFVNDPELIPKDTGVFQRAISKNGQACNTMSRVCRYRNVNFAIAMVKGSPLR